MTSDIADGFVSAGSEENPLIVHDGHILTLPLACSVLNGITPWFVTTLARDLG